MEGVTNDPPSDPPPTSIVPTHLISAPDTSADRYALLTRIICAQAAGEGEGARLVG